MREYEKTGLAPLASQVWVGQTSASGKSSFKPGSPEPTEAQPCKGAIPRIHAHFFDQYGQFGSLDWSGDPVDDGTYRIVDKDRMKIGRVTFQYSIIGGDTLWAGSGDNRRHEAECVGTSHRVQRHPVGRVGVLPGLLVEARRLRTVVLGPGNDAKPIGRSS